MPLACCMARLRGLRRTSAEPRTGSTSSYTGCGPARTCQDEAAAKNNHGTWYDLQLSDYALFLGNREVAAGIIRESERRRIARQIEPDFQQPLELARTKAFDYSVGNLEGLMQLAVLGHEVGVDLWHFQTPDGRCIRKALDFLVPFATGAKPWDYQQIGGF